MVGIITRKDLLPETIEERFEGHGQFTPDGTMADAAQLSTPRRASSGEGDSVSAAAGSSTRSPAQAPAHPAPASLHQVLDVESLPRGGHSSSSVSAAVDGVKGRRTGKHS